jgi:Arc/MetJ-type ribon-helix-helix transcriptional regulator
MHRPIGRAINGQVESGWHKNQSSYIRERSIRYVSQDGENGGI